MPNDTQQPDQAQQPQQVVTAAPRREITPIVNDGAFEMLLDTAKFAQLQRIGTMYARSKLVPDHFKGDEASCMVAVQMAMRLNVDPFMFLQKTFVIGGKPGMEAQLAIALVNTRGPFTGPIDWNFERDQNGKVTKATAFATHKKTGRVCSAEVDWALVESEGWSKKNGSKWLTMREQMFAYRSAVFLARRYCPEVLMGMETADELIDTMKDVTPGEQPDKPAKTKLRERAGVSDAEIVSPDTYTIAKEPAKGQVSAAQAVAQDAQKHEPTQPPPETAKATPAASGAADAAKPVPAIPYEDVLKMAKKAKAREQGEIVLDAMRDPAYTDEQRADVKNILDSKDYNKQGA